MKFEFDNVDEFNILWQSVHDSILHWKRVRRDSISGGLTHYTTDYAEDQIGTNVKLLMDIENNEHPEWDGRGYVMVENPEFHSCMVEQNKKFIKKNGEG